MHIVFPISRHDQRHAVALGRAIAALGPQKGHRATVLSTPETGKEPLLFADLIGNMFDHVERAQTSYTPHGGWPQASNQHFTEAAVYMHRHQDEEHQQWLWHEMDACPIHPDWCNRLMTEMQMANGAGKARPFMGVVNDTLAFREDTQQVETTGRHMVGVGIYPKNLFAVSSLIASSGQMNVPFDHYLQHEILPYCHDTKLMAHRWNTINYSWRGDEIRMADVEPLQYGISHASPINAAEVVFVHGCKDGTLADLVAHKFQPDAPPADDSLNAETEDAPPEDDEQDRAIARPSRRGSRAKATT